MALRIGENNRATAESGVSIATLKALMQIGMLAEKYAKALCPVGTVESTGKKGYRGGTLRNSITYEVDNIKGEVTIGSNVEYAPYVELGTGPNFTPPPDWEKFKKHTGKGVGSGYVKPRPYLRPAIEDHVKEFKDLYMNELKHA